jgi:hypothetical protein
MQNSFHHSILYTVQYSTVHIHNKQDMQKIIYVCKIKNNITILWVLSSSIIFVLISTRALHLLLFPLYAIRYSATRYRYFYSEPDPEPDPEQDRETDLEQDLETDPGQDQELDPAQDPDPSQIVFDQKDPNLDST